MRRAVPETPLLPQTRGGRFRMTPRNMDRAEGVTDEMFAVVQQVALSIFTDMQNNSFSLSETLAAVYLSGVSHALSVAVKGELP